MADSSITVTKSSNFRGRARDIFRTLSFLSDDSDGHIPSVDLAAGDLDDCILTERVYDPGLTTPANSFELRIEEKVTGRLVYLSSEITATTFSRAITTDYNNGYPKIDGAITIKFVAHSDHTSACNVGNAKDGTVILRFEKKGGDR
jgi:hypothetical protein